MIADVSAGACVGSNPSLFDHVEFPDANLALGFCAQCRIVELCLEVVRPQKSRFDGVAGGVVWRNGYRVRADNTTREDRMKPKGEA